MGCSDEGSNQFGKWVNDNPGKGLLLFATAAAAAAAAAGAAAMPVATRIGFNTGETSAREDMAAGAIGGLGGLAGGMAVAFASIVLARMLDCCCESEKNDYNDDNGPIAFGAIAGGFSAPAIGALVARKAVDKVGEGGHYNLDIRKATYAALAIYLAAAIVATGLVNATLQYSKSKNTADIDHISEPSVPEVVVDKQPESSVVNGEGVGVINNGTLVNGNEIEKI